MSSRAFVGLPILKPVRPRETTVPDEQLEAVLHHSPPMLRFSLTLAREAGLRLGTIVRLTAENVDLQNRVVYGRTKAYASYRVPLTDKALAVLRHAVAFAASPSEPLLCQFNRSGKQPRPSTLTTQLARAQRLAKVSGWGHHDLRRTAARALYERTHDLRKVQRFLGHANLQQALWYLGNAAEELTHEDLQPELYEERTA